jgi:LCP family protein required for cell wall assembly
VSAWNSVNKVTIDRPATAVVEAAGEEDPSGDPQTAADEEPEVTVPSSPDGLDVFLLVGSDSRDNLDDLDGFGAFGGQRADVVMVFIKPRSGATAAVVSLPRDLLVDDICSEGSTRLNEALEGCSDTLNGPTALLLTVESLIGVTVDHFGLVDLAGFQEAVDAVGGYEICVELPVRDEQSQLDLPAGCTHATGEQTLAWLRSRHTQELTDTGWHTVAGVSDLTRNERQREFMISMLGELSDISSPDDVTSLARTVAPYVTVDSGLGFLDAVGLAWSLRGLGTSTVQTLEVPVTGDVTEAGAQVLVATEDIAAIVDAYLHPVTADPALSIGR